MAITRLEAGAAEPLAIAILSDPARANKFAGVQKDGIEVVQGSFLDFKCYQGFDVVISLAGNAVMRLQPAMIEAAIEGGVRHFYPSEFGTDINLDGVWDFRYFRDKVVTRDHLVATAKAHPGFQYTLLLVGAFSEWVCGEFSGVDVKKHTVRSYGYPDAQTSVTRTILREIRVRGDHLTFQQVIGVLEEVQGEKYDVQYLDPKEAAQKQEEARKRGDEVEEILWAGKTVGPSGKVQVPLPLDNDKFGFKPETLKQTLTRLYGKK
ncbi:hypothetical protein B0H16DRAFT_1521506 [Mycena metata]|uniref:NmrA-like domain-containing protein n=1 Tax=Mycena metata TaxID=1033252 RepID=A0AAD7JNV3_9AGAR|nr:hypothetical protein B0H16DRAFT_1521506 [Mycena metata]